MRLEKYNSWILEEYLVESKKDWKDGVVEVPTEERIIESKLKALNKRRLELLEHGATTVNAELVQIRKDIRAYKEHLKAIKKER